MRNITNTHSFIHTHKHTHTHSHTHTHKHTQTHKHTHTHTHTYTHTHDFAKCYRFFEVSLPSYVIQGETYACLVQPHYAHDVIEKLHDGHTTKRVILHQLAEHSGLKKGSARQTKQTCLRYFITYILKK